MGRTKLSPGSLPPIALLRAFEAVGRVNGIRSAARELDLDHTVVSRHVSALETWAGVRLVSRSSGAGILLTPEGTRFHARIAAALAEIRDAASELRSQVSGRRLVVWCVPGLAVQWLIGRLADFPGGRTVELHPTDRSPDFGRFEADADIRYVPRTPRPSHSSSSTGVRWAEIASPAVVAVASPALAARLRRVRKPADLQEAPLLHEESDAQWRSWLGANGVAVTADSLNGPRLWHAHLALEAARCSQGIALANHFLIRNDLASGRLVRVAATSESRDITLGSYILSARADRWQTAAIVRFRRWLKAAAQEAAVAQR